MISGGFVERPIYIVKQRILQQKKMNTCYPVTASKKLNRSGSLLFRNHLNRGLELRRLSPLVTDSAHAIKINFVTRKSRVFLVAVSLPIALRGFTELLIILNRWKLYSFKIRLTLSNIYNFVLFSPLNVASKNLRSFIVCSRYVRGTPMGVQRLWITDAAGGVPHAAYAEHSNSQYSKG